MRERIAVVVVVLALSVPARSQGWNKSGAAYAGGDDSDLTEPIDDGVGDDPVEEIPADLMSDDPGAAEAPAARQAPAHAPFSRPGGVGAYVAPVAAEAPRPHHRAAEGPAPESRDAAVELVAQSCHSERGLFCDAVKTDDLKSARCLLQYQDDLLEDCQRALESARPFLKK